MKNISLVLDLHSLAVQVGRVLKQARLTLVTAESCTGGVVAAAITDIAGSSAWFERGFVTYSNASKTELLGIPAEIIEQYGAVSRPVARAMAEGALRNSHARVALSITGVAGPGGGTARAPVGAVCFAWSSRWRTSDEMQRFSGNRCQVRNQAAEYALNGLLKVVAASV
ncbi:Competence-damaged protein CinA [Candidatus Glomeribacter gigasporarum BEG34]|uniref:Competence-damaged protein CinA n=1 Tax=Candidatus Glomeribacter gigasporarum BEG34 TaxID=1070319 RepID=G2J7Y4_9BURK|nr:Competence-damaged protein CinA [Candidatus Glomeribacter gigasporarum BEG34]